jgi:hypothetical protein
LSEPPQVASGLIFEVDEGEGVADRTRELVELDIFLLNVDLSRVDDLVTDLDVVGFNEEDVAR